MHRPQASKCLSPPQRGLPVGSNSLTQQAETTRRPQSPSNHTQRNCVAVPLSPPPSGPPTRVGTTGRHTSTHRCFPHCSVIPTLQVGARRCHPGGSPGPRPKLLRRVRCTRTMQRQPSAPQPARPIADRALRPRPPRTRRQIHIRRRSDRAHECRACTSIQYSGRTKKTRISIAR